MATLKRVITADPHLQMMQDATEYALRNLNGTVTNQGTQIGSAQSSISANSSAITTLQNSLFQSGKLITVTFTGTSPATFTHNLGKTPSIWVICDRTSAATLWRSAWNSTTITLLTDSVTASFLIWIA